MNETVFVISDNGYDLKLFNKTLASRGFCIDRASLYDDVKEKITQNRFAAILADYDLIGGKVHKWLELLQKNRSEACFIVYGENINGEQVSDMLQKGAYAFIPRSHLSDRISDTIAGGLENRKAFIEILHMMDELKQANENLKMEKESLNLKNSQLRFINRLTSKVAYDLNWDKILQRILDSGLQTAIDYESLSLLYRINSQWYLVLHLSERQTEKKTLEKIRKNIITGFREISNEDISNKKLALQIHPSNVKTNSPPGFFSDQCVFPLNLAGKTLGMLTIIPKDIAAFKNGKRELMSTISNILAMSLKNAQEYQKLKKMAVTDDLTGIYNYKGLKDYIQKEFQRAKRYDKILSMIMIDIDNFKSINDNFGHQAGDYVLKELARCLNKHVRNTDIVARYGGDEFAILLPETGSEKAEKLIIRMLKEIRNNSFVWNSKSINVQVSYGISAIGELKRGDEENELIHRADTRLYEAKQFREAFTQF